jgi:trehalose 6-phosphate synthase/phosphatase
MEESIMQFKRLIVVSNRLPIHLKKIDDGVEIIKSSGGLATAIESLLQNQEKGLVFEEVVWCGCAEFNVSTWLKNKKLVADLPYTISPIFPEKTLYDKYYNGFSNTTLWPLFHYFPSFVEYDAEDFVAYEEVNQLFASKLQELMRPGDLVWVHDYHLMPLPALIREATPDAVIGFFLHIPFPSFEIFRLLPRIWREKLLKGLMGADLVGFHTNSYAAHFLKSLQYILGQEHQFRMLSDRGRQVKVDVFPIGIDYDKFHNAYDNEEVIATRIKLKEQYSEKKIIFSVDRLDYSKGLSNRLLAYEHFLQSYPEWKKKVVFIFVIVPSRDKVSRYSERKQIIDEIVSRVNGRQGNINWQPIVYQYGSLTDRELSALYGVCDLALITPIRDGMNLVSKEFVASRKDKQGVLILSEMAGAASELSEALLINPTDKIEMADKIKAGLELSPAKQERRIELMQERIRNYDVHHWAFDFITQIDRLKIQYEKQKVRFLDHRIRTKIAVAFSEANKRLFLLDYDGTLAEFSLSPENAIPSQQTIDTLTTLANHPKNEVVVISGRNHEFLEKHFGHLPITLVAEHGSLMKYKNEEWVSPTHISNEWKEVIKPILKTFVQRCPNTFLEEKTYSLAWHYRRAEAELGFVRSRELLVTLLEIANNDLKIIDGNKVIEIKNTGIDKGTACRQLMVKENYDFVLAIGDDRTDEDMFTALTAENNFTIKVGTSQSAAKYYLLTVQQVHSFLANFCN